MKIGIIGVGNVGRSVGGLLQRAGHKLRFGLRQQHDASGFPAPVGTPAEAAAFGDVILCAVPYGAWPTLARELTPHVIGKVVIDASNPSPKRDGAFAESAIDAGQGAGISVANLLPEARLVRAFNSVPWPGMVAEANRPGERIAIPLAGDDEDARLTVGQLVRDSGFDPIDVGPLVRSRSFDPGGPGYNHPMPAEQMRRVLGLT